MEQAKSGQIKLMVRNIYIPTNIYIITKHEIQVN